MIDWLSFVTVLVASVVAACLVVLLFALGLRWVGAGSGWRRPVAIGCFTLCAIVILFGVYLIIPALHK